MNPILAGLLPLIITITLALTALITVGVFSYLMLLRLARGEFEPEEQEHEE